eukprot:1160824-Pelagomonas_calceolata.AAC.10
MQARRHKPDKAGGSHGWAHRGGRHSCVSQPLWQLWDGGQRVRSPGQEHEYVLALMIVKQGSTGQTP